MYLLEAIQSAACARHHGVPRIPIYPDVHLTCSPNLAATSPAHLHNQKLPPFRLFSCFPHLPQSLTLLGRTPFTVSTRTASRRLSTAPGGSGAGTRSSPPPCQRSHRARAPEGTAPDKERSGRSGGEDVSRFPAVRRGVGIGSRSRNGLCKGGGGSSCCAGLGWREASKTGKK